MLLTKVLFRLCVESFDLFSNLASVLSVLVYWTSFCLPEKCQSIGDIKGLLTEREVCTVKYRTEVF